MSNMNIPKKVKLVGMSATKLHYDGEFICHGYVTGSIKDVEVKDIVGGDTIIGSDGGLYSLKPEFDDDFYVVVLEEIGGEKMRDNIGLQRTATDLMDEYASAFRKTMLDLVVRRALEDNRELVTDDDVDYIIADLVSNEYNFINGGESCWRKKNE